MSFSAAAFVVAYGASLCVLALLFNGVETSFVSFLWNAFILGTCILAVLLGLYGMGVIGGN